MNLSSHFARTALLAFPVAALLATFTLSMAPISQAQPSRPPQPGQSKPTGKPTPSTPPTNGKPAAAGNWQKFRFPEGRFTVAFPQKPVTSSEKDADGDVSYVYKVERNEDYYVISHIDIAALQDRPVSEVQEILQKMPVDMVKKVDGKLVNNKKITLRKNPGQEFDFLITVGGKEAAGKGRIYVVGTRVYTLLSVGNPKDLSRFVNSFNLI